MIYYFSVYKFFLWPTNYYLDNKVFFRLNYFCRQQIFFQIQFFLQTTNYLWISNYFSEQNIFGGFIFVSKINFPDNKFLIGEQFLFGWQIFCGQQILYQTINYFFRQILFCRQLILFWATNSFSDSKVTLFQKINYFWKTKSFFVPQKLLPEFCTANYFYFYNKLKKIIGFIVFT